VPPKPATQAIADGAAAADLRDQAMAGREIGSIAFERDFSDLSHFTRRFEQRFGCRPRDWRGAR
jgi:AraC family transcriptional activator of tynA and feaB